MDGERSNTSLAPRDIQSVWINGRLELTTSLISTGTNSCFPLLIPLISRINASIRYDADRMSRSADSIDAESYQMIGVVQFMHHARGVAAKIRQSPRQEHLSTQFFLG